MKRIKLAAVTVAAAALAGAGLLLGAMGAAAASPGFEPDSNALGALTFYDSSGHVVTGGNNLNHLFAFAAADSAGQAGANKATLYFGYPDHTKADPLQWSTTQASASSTFPNSSAPPPVNGITNPVASPSAGDVNLTAALGSQTLDTTPGYANIIEIRLKDSGPGISQQDQYWRTDIQYDSAAGTWQQVFPAVATTSITAITANPPSPAPAGTTSVALSATLSASDSSHPTGSVELLDGSTDLGAATFNAATGAISKTATVANNGSYSFTFVFTPNTAIAGSTSPGLAYTVAGPAKTTATVVSGPTTTTVGSAVTIHADVLTPDASGTAVPAGVGKVQFKVEGANSGSPVNVTASGADFSFNPSAPGDSHITATFLPNDSSKYVTSDGNTVTVTATAAAYQPDPQNVTVTVPQGTLVISTPYTVANPFKLGTMVLNADGTQYSASAPFGDPSANGAPDQGSLGNTPLASYPANKTANGIAITDTRAASQGWTASAQTSDFVGPGTSTIDGNNLTLTNVLPKYLNNNALQAGSVNTHDIDHFKAAKKAFADTTHGPGTVNIVGNMNLTAPTSTQPGDYTATVTFTIV